MVKRSFNQIAGRDVKMLRVMEGLCEDVQCICKILQLLKDSGTNYLALTKEVSRGVHKLLRIHSAAPTATKYLYSAMSFHCRHPLPLFSTPSYKGHGYKLSTQRFLGFFGWTSVSYDWSMVFKATINQS